MKTLLSLVAGLFAFSSVAVEIAFETPFGPFRTVVPEFPARDFPITDYGATPDGKCTSAFAAAMAACKEFSRIVHAKDVTIDNAGK